MTERRYEWRLVDPRPDDAYARVADLVARLERAAEVLAEEYPGLRADVWSAGPRSTLWFRTTEGTRLRGTVTPFAGGFRATVRGAGHIRFRRHAIVRRLERLLTST